MQMFRPIYVFAAAVWVDTYLLLFAASYILMYDCTSCLYGCVYVRLHVVCQKVVDCSAACQDNLEKRFLISARFHSCLNKVHNNINNNTRPDKRQEESIL